MVLWADVRFFVPPGKNRVPYTSKYPDNRTSLEQKFADIELLTIFVAPSRMNLREARMAELVDALVSNTNGAIRAGSIPAPGTMKIA